LRSLDEIEKRRALQLRASKRGIELSDSVIDFIYQRCDRSMSGLIDVLLKLDHSSLIHKRKLTIPLIKTTMAW
jgi:DnaA family protein